MLDKELIVMWWQAIIGVAGAVVVTALATLAVLRRRSRDGWPARPPRSAATVTSLDQDDLAEGLIGAYDLAAGSPAVRDYVQQVLRGAGISPLTAEPGTVFDPAHHLAVDTEPAGSREAGTIARLVRPGWVAGETLLRPAEVVVWTR